MRKLLLQLCILTGISISAYTQDGHYTSFFSAPLYLNPGLTGISDDSSFRLGGIYRSQWRSLDAPYRNYHFYFDQRNERISFGMLLNQNNTGRAGLKTTNALLSFALKKKLAKGNNILSLGLQLGMLQQRVDPEALTFDNQYNPEKGYDADLESGEQFEATSVLLPDMNIGLNWHFSKDFGIPIEGNTGISFSHINAPKSSFLDENIQYPLKSTIYGVAEIGFTEIFGLEPFVLFMGQQNARQFSYGMHAVLHVNDQSKLKIGIGYREQDAITLMGSLGFGNISLGLSYDSKKAIVDNPFDARTFELSATYLIGRTGTASSPSGEKKLTNPLADLKDFDGDGVTDESDFCPYETGTPEHQGCNDSDGDGIWDHEDACPSIPGKLENYGCPMKRSELDSDADGVLDNDDLCVYIFGSKALKGCPDTDQDGVSDQEDDCPYLPGLKTNKGCPESGKGHFSEAVIEFDTDRADIKGLYYPFLDRIAFQLKNRSDLSLVIEGHTDDEGSHLYNYQLSKKRAINVREYLLKKGVSENQTVLYFFGETKPKVPKQNAEGRQRNRRVKLILTGR